MQLSVLIVNYNAKYFAEHCLLSVQKACEGINAEILVFDNASQDGSKEYLDSKFPNAQFFWSDENLGFGKANNRLLEQAKGEHILFLNPDTIVAEDCFSKCLDFFKQHNDCGAIGVRMIDGCGKFLPESKRGFPDASASLFKILGLAKMFSTSKSFAAYYAGHLPEKETNKTDVLAGAFIMLSRAALEKVKGFDEQFFMYGEDIDLSYRINEAGFSNYYFAGITIIHFKGESTQKKSTAHKEQFYGAMKLFAAKHYSGFKKTMINAGINLNRFAGSIKSNLTKDADQQKMPEKILFVGSSSDDLIQPKKICADNNISGEEISADHISMQKGNYGICLCEGKLTNKRIIELLQEKNEMNFFFHQKNADSIISSNNKNANGIFIAARQ